MGPYIGRNGKTDVQLPFAHCMLCHGQLDPCKVEWPCCGRTASLSPALLWKHEWLEAVRRSARHVPGDPTPPHHIHKAKGFIILLDPAKLSLPLGVLHISCCVLHQGVCWRTGMENKRTWNSCPCERGLRFFCCGSSFVLFWLSMAVSPGFGWAIIWCSASALQEMMTHSKSH